MEEGGTLLVDPAPPTHIVPVVTSPIGSSTVQLPIANDPLLEGVVLRGQWGVQDAGAVQGLALSGGLAITIGR